MQSRVVFACVLACWLLVATVGQLLADRVFLVVLGAVMVVTVYVWVRCTLKAVERQRSPERHQAELEDVRRRAEARGYVAGARKRLDSEGSMRLRLVRGDGQRPHPY
ncbi:hypothetical protein [Micromonospora craniellae]|uniref:Uncharacterized protein n=1 Tax=Micromonospora craniellae TaxID=2294034 RepID=A0A372G2T7_9ACTN|nr:hypothetical protein [Micromonospora craniellae]QOC89894.1 hypothetical protein ID554_16805 [Micromonospora craniellae]RFS47040.1 hypothetical protein D0Q02_07720 [Micromonospora craniellae]